MYAIRSYYEDQRFESDPDGDGRCHYTDGPRVHEYLQELSREAFRPLGTMTVGEVDILQLVDNWRQLLRFYLMQKQLEAQLGQSVASLARVVGAYEITVTH